MNWITFNGSNIFLIPEAITFLVNVFVKNTSNLCTHCTGKHVSYSKLIPLFASFVIFLRCRYTCLKWEFADIHLNMMFQLSLLFSWHRQMVGIISAIGFPF